MKYVFLCAALVAPSSVTAEARSFDCEALDAQQPETKAHLIKYEDQNRGHITIGSIDRDVDVYPGPDTLTFLYFGDGYTLTYSVHPVAGTYDYSASGSKSGFGKGTCTETTGQ